MKILVTGANGMLGQDLCPILEDNGYDVIETDLENMDITSKNAISDTLKIEKPDFVIHCAAFNDIEISENNPEQVTLINEQGTENIARICGTMDIPILYISSSYVFDGTKTTPYTTSDVPKPINNFGASKYLGEEAIRKYCEQYFIIRTGLLYGHHKTNFVEMILENDDIEISVVNDVICSATWTVDLANEIVNFIDSEDFGTYHIANSGEVNLFEFAKEICKLSNNDAKIVPCNIDKLQLNYKTPKYTALESNIKCRNWKQALKDYLSLRI